MGLVIALRARTAARRTEDLDETFVTAMTHCLRT